MNKTIEKAGISGRMNITDLHRKMFELQDMKYREMQIKIIPTITPESVIGVRTPELKNMAKRKCFLGITGFYASR